MPHYPDPQATRRLLGRSREALVATQNDLAQLLGVTRRTIGRWEGGDGTIGASGLEKLARIVHDADASLAAEIAAEAGTTLEKMGLATRAPPPGAPMPTVNRPFPPVELLLEGVLHVGVQALVDAQGSPPLDAVKSILGATLSRASGLGLTLAEMVEALSHLPPARAARGGSSKS